MLGGQQAITCLRLLLAALLAASSCLGAPEQAGSNGTDTLLLDSGQWFALPARAAECEATGGLVAPRHSSMVRAERRRLPYGSLQPLQSSVCDWAGCFAGAGRLDTRSGAGHGVRLCELLLFLEYMAAAASAHDRECERMGGDAAAVQVLTTLVSNGTFGDPNIGATNLHIPDVFHAGRCFYTYWFTTNFTLPANATAGGRRARLTFLGINYSARWGEGAAGPRCAPVVRRVVPEMCQPDGESRHSEEVSSSLACHCFPASLQASRYGGKHEKHLLQHPDIVLGSYTSAA